MNKTDCDKIAYILCEGAVPQHIREKFFELDARIEPNYQDWLDFEGRREGVQERFEELMVKKFGHNWSLLKVMKNNPRLRENMTQARMEIYGEDYDPSLFK